MYRKAVELKHTAEREVKEKNINEEKLKEGEEGEEMEEEEMKKGQRIARWMKESYTCGNGCQNWKEGRSP